jgi:hypothetical protein
MMLAAFGILAAWAVVGSLNTSSPTLSIIAVALLVLVVPARSLERRGRMTWLPPTLGSAFLGTLIVDEWVRGRGAGSIVMIGILTALFAGFTVVAVVEGTRGLRRRPPQ